MPDTSPLIVKARLADADGYAEWERLASELRPQPSMYPGYFAAWCDSRDPVATTELITARRDGVLEAILPVISSRRALSGVIDADEVGMLAKGPGAADAIAQYLFAERGASLRLLPVSSAGATWPAVQRRARQTGAKTRWREIEQRPIIRIDTDWESFWSARSRKLRQDIRRRRRRAGEQGELRTQIIRKPADVPAALEEALRVEAAGWKGQGGTAINENPADREYYRRLAAWAAERDWLRLALLKLDDATIAMQFGLQADGVLYSLKLGFDEEYSSLSPGKLLLAAEIERSFSEGLRLFDFAGQAASYKNSWATEFATYGELIATPPGLFGRAEWTTVQLKDWARPRAKQARAWLRRGVAGRRGGSGS